MWYRATVSVPALNSMASFDFTMDTSAAWASRGCKPPETNAATASNQRQRMGGFLSWRAGCREAPEGGGACSVGRRAARVKLATLRRSVAVRLNWRHGEQEETHPRGA